MNQNTASQPYILCVENDESDKKMICAVLEKSDLVVKHISNEDELLEYAKTHRDPYLMLLSHNVADK